MNDYPVILSYFAQSPDEVHLGMLIEEESAIKQVWERATQDQSNPISVVFLARDGRETTVEHLIQDIRTYGDRIVLFHFSGHAGHDQLLLTDGSGGSEGIAGMLAKSAPNLKLVVLNGCSTGGQVEAFFRGRVPAVIATQCAIKDSLAKVFSVELHTSLAQGKSIEWAYGFAVSATKTYKKKPDELFTSLPSSVPESAMIFRSGMLETRPPTALIWELLVRNDGPMLIADPRWYVIQYLAAKNPKINPEKAYIVERGEAPYIHTFATRLDKLNPTRSAIQHHMVVGQQAESPIGLIRKFFYERVINENEQQDFSKGSYYYCFQHSPPEKGYIEIQPTDKLPAYILYRLVSKINPYSKPTDLANQLRTSDDLCAEFFNHNPFKQRRYVVIAFWISAKSAQVDGVTSAIQQTIQLLNSWSGKQPTGVSFLFFWAFEQQRSLMDSFLLRNPVKKLYARFEPLWQTPEKPQVYVINEDFQFLEKPLPRDIDNWMNHDFCKAIPDEVLERLKTEENVETLETKLRQLIETTNGQLQN